MVTGKSPERRWLAEIAVRCFHEQTHSNRELIIVNDGVPLGESIDTSLISEIIPDSNGGPYLLGELRNIGLSHARGDIVIQWDDDDWHHPQRMSAQLRGAEAGIAVLLKRQIRYSFVTQAAMLSVRHKGIHGTILHFNDRSLKYPPLARSEDSFFLSQFKSRTVIDSEVPLYVRFAHGENTWPESHIMERRDSDLDLTDQLHSYLRHILKEYYGIK